MEHWDEARGDRSIDYRERAERVRRSFNERFWFAAGRHLYDVIDGDDGRPDSRCRPNQILAIALPHPVLEEERWGSVMRTVRDRLVTPVGLRSLAPDDPEYRAHYFGD